MRFISSLPPPASVEEEEVPRPVRGTPPIRPVGPRTRAPQVIQHFGSQARAEEVAGGPKTVRPVERASGDRRGLCRRLQHGQPFLDTRSTEDRRKNKRRDSDIVTTLDEEG